LMDPTQRKSERSGIGLAASLAVREGQEADRLEARPAFDTTDAFHKRIEAGWARGESARLLGSLPESLVGDAGTEIVPGIRPGDDPTNTRLSMVDTLAVPDVIAVDASEQRAHLATKVGALSSAIDTAKTAKAKNSIEKMLCHQMAVCHNAGMDLIGRYQDSGVFNNKMPVVEQIRFINAAARMFDASQTAALTLQKMQSGGKQHVVVQYQQQVNVSDGGKAVVASKASTVRTGLRGRNGLKR
jgi:hypothetical protein